jgi:hypothetical protein
MIDIHRAMTPWIRAFWSEILNRGCTLSRRGEQVDLLGWKVRFAWDKDSCLGTLHLHPANTLTSAFDRSMSVFVTSNPREQARLLLRNLAEPLPSGHVVA